MPWNSAPLSLLSLELYPCYQSDEEVLHCIGLRTDVRTVQSVWFANSLWDVWQSAVAWLDSAQTKLSTLCLSLLQYAEVYSYEFLCAKTIIYINISSQSYCSLWQTEWGYDHGLNRFTETVFQNCIFDWILS